MIGTQIKMEIKHTKDEITFTFKSFQPRYNPYLSELDQHTLGDYPTFTGLIIRHPGYDEIGFAGTIDMDYKGKPDQVSDIIVAWQGDEEDFKQKCKELEIDIIELDYDRGRD